MVEDRALLTGLQSSARGRRMWGSCQGYGTCCDERIAADLHVGIEIVPLLASASAETADLGRKHKPLITHARTHALYPIF